MKMTIQHTGNMAQWVSALCAVAAVGGLIWQVNNIRLSAKEAFGRQVYLSVSEMGLRYPEFLDPNIKEINSDRMKWAQYQAYVAHLLFAYDELFTVLDAPEWDATFKQDVSDHIPYFCNHVDVKEYMMQYFPKLKEKLRRVVLQKPDTSCSNRQEWLSLG